MTVFLQIVFFTCLGGMLATYLLYPAFLRLLGAGKHPHFLLPARDELPTIEVVFAAYNEEAVLADKLQSLLQSDYPSSKLTIRVGSDQSTDKTNAILEEFAEKHPQVRPHLFEERQGKASILNQLVEDCEAELLVFTDANIIFEKNTLTELAAAMQTSGAGACGGLIHYQEVGHHGISRQENDYLNFENKLKKAESENFGLCMGLEGGCYILRRELFPGIPPLFFMEDFYVTLSVLQKGYKVLFNSHAQVHEDVSIYGLEEYKRKARISIGNFQNLGRFKSLLWRKWWPVGFSFLFHKILRWLTPFFMILLLSSSMLLLKTSAFFALFTGFYMLFIGLGLFGILFSQQQKAGLLKYPGHFLYMNLALLDGFFTYLNGVQSNAWQPTTRNQK